MRKFNQKPFYLVFLVFCFLLCESQAVIDIPGADGSDGEFAPTENIEIDLSLATTSAWNIPNEEASGNGVYDAEKWAVVFKYSSVNIPEGVTVTFKNHPSFAPVVWLVGGDVVINGTVDVGAKVAHQPEPGPGGFHGGLPAGTQLLDGIGIGPGAKGHRSHGGYSTAGASGDDRVYGNSQILPLIGGSGGSGSGSLIGMGGGGAILIAGTSQINISGSILANSERHHFEGSGGAIRLICDQLNGTGQLQALSLEHGGQGRIRLEANTFTNSLNVNPFTKVVQPDNPVLIWPRDTAPTARIVSIGGQTAPIDPRYINAYDTADPDVKLNTPDPVDVVIETTNAEPTGTTVQLFLKPIRGQDSVLDAQFISGDVTLSTWTVAGVNLPQGAYVLQVRAVTD